MVEVSVVVPTTGRPSLRAAVESVLNQSLPRNLLEIIVVVDRPEGQAPITGDLGQILDQVDHVIYTGGVGNGGAARQIGTEVASGRWVAYLDDDDLWCPTKLELQLRAAADGVTMVSGRVVEVSAGGRTSKEVPSELYKAQPIQDYLFRRRGPVVGRASIFTSTLLVWRHLALDAGWDPTLPRHQDWDFLLRCQDAGGRLLQVPDVVTQIAVGSPNSISATARWRESLAWVKSISAGWRGATIVDFVAGQPLRYSLQARSWEGVRECFRAVASIKRWPSPPSLLLGLAGLVPRAQLERVFFWTHDRRR